jgi:LDH2 family malate/lactate/ureidoglycolate dehydrogenase
LEPIRVHHDDLARFIAAAFAAKGMQAADAAVMADVLVWANLRGGDGHGVARLPRYLEMIDHGDMDPRGRPHLVRDTDAFFILDAGRAAGPIALMEAVVTATERAKARGAAIAIMRDATHAGAIGRYALVPVERGCACIILAAAYPFMPYHGAKVPSLPTAPVVIGVPTERHGPVVLDMASSIVAMGKINQARTKCEPLPDGVALDRDGRPTTDPLAATMPLPLGGPKGSGLSLMIEFLTGALGGAAILTRVLGAEKSTRNTQNALIVVMDVAAFRPDGGFFADADELADLIKALPLREGFDEILLPGERGRRVEAERRAKGIPLPANTWNALKAISAAHAIALPTTRTG